MALLAAGVFLIGNNSYRFRPTYRLRAEFDNVAGLVPGSVSLILADHLPWDQVFWITAAFMVPGVLATFWVREPQGKTPWDRQT